MQIGGSTFIVTGGASGLGAAAARMIVEGGGNVVIVDLKEDEGRAAERELGSSARFVRTDVADETSGNAAVAFALAAVTSIHGLVSCAGIVHGEKVVGKEGPHTFAGFARAIGINLIGTFNLVRLAAAAMANNAPNAGGERGVIVNTASVAAFDGQIGQAAYSASKGGIVGMTLPIAREFARVGIRVMTIAPGTFDTPLLAALPEEARTALGRSVPFPPRLGRPDEYAAVALHIVENRMLNGETVRLDGALRMAPR